MLFVTEKTSLRIAAGRCPVCCSLPPLSDTITTTTTTSTATARSLSSPHLFRSARDSKEAGRRIRRVVHVPPRPVNVHVAAGTFNSSVIDIVDIEHFYDSPRVSGIGCFVCSSFDGENKGCEDPFNSTMELNTRDRETSTLANYNYPCWAYKKGRHGLFPADHCIKIIGYRAENQSKSLVIRTCALDSGTLTADTEIVRISHCGSFKYEGHHYKGCTRMAMDLMGMVNRLDASNNEETLNYVLLGAPRHEKLPNHPTYLEMFQRAIRTLNGKNGISPAAILKYIAQNYHVGENLPKLKTQLRGYLSGVVGNGEMINENGNFALNPAIEAEKDLQRLLANSSASENWEKKEKKAPKRKQRRMIAKKRNAPKKSAPRAKSGVKKTDKLSRTANQPKMTMTLRNQLSLQHEQKKMADKLNMTLDDIIKMKKKEDRKDNGQKNGGKPGKKFLNKNGKQVPVRRGVAARGAKGAVARGAGARGARATVAIKRSLAVRQGIKKGAVVNQATKKLVQKLVKNALRKTGATGVAKAQLRKRGGVAPSTIAARRNRAPISRVLQQSRTISRKPIRMPVQRVVQQRQRVVAPQQQPRRQVVRQVITAPAPAQRVVRRPQPRQVIVQQVVERPRQQNRQFVTRPVQQRQRVQRQVVQVQRVRPQPQYQRVVERVVERRVPVQQFRQTNRSFSRNNDRFRNSVAVPARNRRVVREVQRVPTFQYVTERVVRRGRRFAAY
ncbi:unnamed protein product [Caenorhabditis bovis]|uniref:H15 domain-containing protein n=1 Tax=Caenorhabditis bovis TaxID=2654633 RepID=A0A8S1ECX1_9PELO|nr:unnamed protein product [Caenorhabditis bovis]